ncbi:MAG TPA: DNA polymerase III subunit beta [Thermaerobacter sp.]
MRLTIDQHDLQSALSVVSRAVKGHPTMPLLSGVWLRAEGNSLIATGTDLTITIQATVPANVEADGEVVLPARPLLELVRKFSGGEIRIDVDEQHATITWNRSRHRLHGIAPNLRPESLAVHDGEPVTLDAETLKDILWRTTFAVSTDETRPILTGVQIQGDGQNMRAIATDGYRVAVVTRNGLSFDRSLSAVIPGRALAEVGRLLGDEETVTLVLGESTAAVELGDVRLVTRLIDGDYPDVLSLLPSEYPHKVRVQRQEFLQALERAALVAQGQQTSKHVVRLDIESDRMVITASDPQLGTAREEVPAQLQGEGMAIGFNARFLIDGLKVIESEEVEIGLTGPLQAAQIRGVDKEGFRYVVLPVKLGDREGVPF